MIFADSSFLIAYMIGRDSNHEAAAHLFERFADRRIVTTNHVRGETWTWLCSRTWHGKAVAFLDSVGKASSYIEVARLPVEPEDESLRWLRKHDEREYSFVDATSFAYMRARGIQEALAFDGDFAAAGFTELRP
ncbi:MAG TPA: PIN domain-containing protein [Solirubrobacterales bacterium]|nr:PIN domain-containing protein [Solirubrobacterales bacterium]